MAKPFDTSSGDLLADRRADYADMLFASDDPAAAAEVMLGALELAPQWSLGWFRLGEFYEVAGNVAAAIQAWRTAQRLDPADRAGAGLKLELAGAEPASGAAPGAFVETLFDQYADRFDHALVDTLGYRVPELLFAAIDACREGTFSHAVDLGCGTGLMGERLRPLAQRLDGYDISAEMLRKARSKNVYDRLEKADLQAMAWQRERVDLVTAADVFMYVGALERVGALAAAMLAPGGLFAFSVESHDGTEDYVLRPSRRYAHSERDVRRTLSAHGLQVLSLARERIRMDRGEPIEGLIVVATAVAAA
ncbi:MAG: methyltransferase domain-containing protein [Rhizobiaceae bacterium]|nr:methyltransferase domain-containing protein [Rhizobiaceae bacterium]